jgi:hypothetical protein
MPQPPTHPQLVATSSRPAPEGEPLARRILPLITMIAGSATAALGLAVMVGWHFDNRALVQLDPALAPMHYNAARIFLPSRSSDWPPDF